MPGLRRKNKQCCKPADDIYRVSLNSFIYLYKNKLKAMILNDKNKSNEIKHYLTEHQIHDLKDIEITSLEEFVNIK